MTTPVWMKNLSKAQVDLVNEIIAQIPEAHGVQAAFTDILNTIGGASVAPKFRYYIADCTNGDVRCTNNEDIANNYASSEDNFVVDVQDHTWIQADLDTAEVKEV